MTQTERVLRALTSAGKRGITQVDFLRFPAIDGRGPITRLAARIQDLEDAGHIIERAGTRDKCVIYRLAATALPILGETSDPPSTLFDPPVAPPRNALDDDWAA
jgi:hypothetical protein